MKVKIIPVPFERAEHVIEDHLNNDWRCISFTMVDKACLVLFIKSDELKEDLHHIDDTALAREIATRIQDEALGAVTRRYDVSKGYAVALSCIRNLKPVVRTGDELSLLIERLESTSLSVVTNADLAKMARLLVGRFSK